MRVTFAYPWTDPETNTTHDADATVEVDDSTGGNLIAAGTARAAVTGETTNKKKDVA